MRVQCEFFCNSTFIQEMITSFLEAWNSLSFWLKTKEIVPLFSKERNSLKDLLINDYLSHNLELYRSHFTHFYTIIIIDAICFIIL